MSFFTYEDGSPKGWNIGCAALAFMIAAPVACSAYSSFTSVTSAPGRVVGRTLQTDNIIQNYEGFYNRNANYGVRLAQVAEYRDYLKNETDADEKQRLRIELSAMRLSCRELAAGYNADSAKQNRALFKSKGLPPVLSEEDCNA